MCYSYKDREAMEEARKTMRDREERRRREERARGEERRAPEKERKLVRA